MQRDSSMFLYRKMSNDTSWVKGILGDKELRKLHIKIRKFIPK